MNFLVTAGPTREPIDPVRFLSNRSSGKMGYAIAQAALDAGHAVTLISGPVSLARPAGAEFLRVVTSDEMFDAVQRCVSRETFDVLVMCAAVSDFKPAEIRARKIKKSEGLANLDLVPARDVLKSLALPETKKLFVLGFAAETEELEKNAKKKLREKQCDAIAANDVSRMDTGFESDDNALAVFTRGGGVRKFSRANKVILAKALIELCEEFAEKR